MASTFLFHFPRLICILVVVTARIKAVNGHWLIVPNVDKTKLFFCLKSKIFSLKNCYSTAFYFSLEPNFVGSFEKDDKVYFLFRETAVENINCGKVSPSVLMSSWCCEVMVCCLQSCQSLCPPCLKAPNHDLVCDPRCCNGPESHWRDSFSYSGVVAILAPHPG